MISTTMRFIHIYTQAALLFRKLREADSVEEYAQLEAELKPLLEELKGLRAKPDFDTAEAKAARDTATEQNLRTGAHLDNLWPGGSPADKADQPPPPPPPPPPLTEFPYGRVLSFHPQQTNEAHLLKSGDKMYKMIAGGKYQVRRADDSTRPDPDVWEGLGLVP